MCGDHAGDVNILWAEEIAGTTQQAAEECRGDLVMRCIVLQRLENPLRAELYVAPLLPHWAGE